jgi:hypothetical protein
MAAVAVGAAAMAPCLTGCRTLPTVSGPRVLFSVADPPAYYRESLPIEPGNSTVALKVDAARADADDEAQPSGWWHYLEFYRKGRYITGIYKGPAVGAEAMSFDVCRSYVPESATHIRFGFGGSRDDAAYFKILSAQLIQEQHPWPPPRATAVPDWVDKDPGPSHLPIRWTTGRGVSIGDAPEPFYPFGIYMVRETEMEKVKEAGFNLIQHYGADGAADDVTLAWLDAAHVQGLKAFVAFNREKLKVMDMAYVAERVRALRDHPALLAWYLFDEPELPKHGLSPSRLQPTYDLIKRLDPSRPVLLTCYHEAMIPDYTDCFDVYLTQAYHSTAAAVAKETVLTSNVLANHPGKSGAIIVNNKIPFAPYAEVRAGAYIAMMYQGGLLWWGWWDDYHMRKFTKGSRRFHQRFQKAATQDEKRDEFQAEIRRLMDEIHGVRGVFTVRGKVQRSVQNDVHAYVKTASERTYAVLVCVGDNGAIQMPLPGLNALTPILGTTAFEFQNGTLSVHLRKGQILILEGKRVQ